MKTKEYLNGGHFGIRCIMRVRSHNNVGRAVQTDPYIVASRFAEITEQKFLEVVDSKV